MIELKVIEKFMEDNGLEPYDAFDVECALTKSLKLLMEKSPRMKKLNSMIITGIAFAQM